MARQKKKKKPGRIPRSSTLAQHKRDRKVLTPPLMTLPSPMSAVSYTRDFLPDLLWIASLSHKGAEFSDVYKALDVLDELFPPARVERDGKKTMEYVDGRLSSFAYVPHDVRPAAREALREKTPWALPEDLGHAILLYPECPAVWLYEEWGEGRSVDPEIGVRYLKSLLTAFWDRSAVVSTRLRMTVIARMLKAGQLPVPRSMAEEWSKYPSNLSEDDQRKVEAGARASYNLQASRDFAPPAAYPWAEYFWRQNWKISTCDWIETGTPWDSLDGEDGEEDEGEMEDLLAPSAPGPPSQARFELVHTGWLAAVRALGDELRLREERAELDLWEPIPDEVRLGLASRQFRLLSELIEDPQLWSSTSAAHLLRSVVETRIVLAWLLQKDDFDLYRRFRDYGLGKNKLYKLHIEDYIEKHGGTDELHKMRETLDREVNAEIMEEFQAIDLGGNFAGISIRDMAKEASLETLYSLNYQPLSAEAHGEWSSLRAHDLVTCVNPLHHFHRIGRFRGGDLPPNITLIHVCLDLVEDTVAQAFNYYGIDVEDAFDTALAAMNEAAAAASA